MIVVHCLDGQTMFVNADLIESITSGDPVVLRLADGTSFEVQDDPATLVERIRNFRASVLVAAEDLRDGTPARLVLLHGDTADAAEGERPD